MENLGGYRQDVKSICNTFMEFGYDIRVYEDLEAKELLLTVKKLAKEKKCSKIESKDSIFKGYASIVIWVLSYHGALGTVYGHDGKQVSVSELQWAFGIENCFDLADKPKIFFIQGHCPQQKHSEVEQRSEKDLPISNVTPPISNAVLLLGSSTVDPYVGTKFVQNLCFHLRFVDKVRVKGMRDLYEAHFDFTQETAKELFLITKGPVILNNEIPLYLSTVVCDKTVGFQIVTPEKRCKCIYYYYTKSNKTNGQYLEKYCNTMKTKPTFIYQQIISKYAFFVTFT